MLKGFAVPFEFLSAAHFVEKITTSSKCLRSDRSSTSSTESRSLTEKHPKTLDNHGKCKVQVEIEEEMFCLMPNTLDSQDINRHWT